jgi:hypothetical protein
MHENDRADVGGSGAAERADLSSSESEVARAVRPQEPPEDSRLTQIKQLMAEQKKLRSYASWRCLTNNGWIEELEKILTPPASNPKSEPERLPVRQPDTIRE